MEESFSHGSAKEKDVAPKATLTPGTLESP
jgi:hypothetical protein